MRWMFFLSIALLLTKGGIAVLDGQTFSLDEIRQVATMVPGKRPLRINVLKFAESRRTKNFSVKGAPPEPSAQARTVFQVVYADGYIMIDSGMDQQVHKFFGRRVEEPY